PISDTPRVPESVTGLPKETCITRDIPWPYQRGSARSGSPNTSSWVGCSPLSSQPSEHRPRLELWPSRPSASRTSWATGTSPRPRALPGTASLISLRFSPYPWCGGFCERGRHKRDACCAPGLGKASPRKELSYRQVVAAHSTDLRRIVLKHPRLPQRTGLLR